MKGLFLFKRKKYNEAIPFLQHSLEIKPEEWMPYYTLAEIYAIKNKKSDSLIHLDKAIILNSWCKENAKENPSFDKIRNSFEFLALIE